jgi:alcohol dehydrogenase
MGGLHVGLELPYVQLMRNCIAVRGQYMYPRDAPVRLAGLIRSGLLSLESFEVTGFPLEQTNEAVVHAAEHGGPFRITVIEP